MSALVTTAMQINILGLFILVSNENLIRSSTVALAGNVGRIADVANLKNKC